MLGRLLLAHVGGDRESVADLVAYEMDANPAGGFTNIIDIAFDDDGNLYVLEIAHKNLLAESPEGALIKFDSDGTRSIVIDGLFFPGGVALDDDGDLYVTDCGICPTDGEVLHITP